MTAGSNKSSKRLHNDDEVTQPADAFDRQDKECVVQVKFLSTWKVPAYNKQRL